MGVKDPFQRKAVKAIAFFGKAAIDMTGRWR